MKKLKISKKVVIPVVILLAAGGVGLYVATTTNATPEQKMVDVYGTRIDAIRCELVDVYYMYDDLMGSVAKAGLTEQERQYVQLRYFDGLRPGKVAEKMNYSEKQLRRIRNSVIDKLTER